MKNKHKWHKEIKAWADGAEIEARDRLTPLHSWSVWARILVPNWSISDLIEYRIKPQPKLVPFDFSEAERLIGKAVKGIDDDIGYYIIGSVNKNGVFLVNTTTITSYLTLLSLYMFIDGSPCGKEVIVKE